MLWQFLTWWLSINIFALILLATRKLKLHESYFKVAAPLEMLLYLLYSIFLIRLWSNHYNNIGLAIFILGLLLNVLVMIVNKGLMPVDLDEFKRVSSLGESAARIELMELCALRKRHVIMDDSTKLKALGDRYGHFPGLFSGYSVESLGDKLMEKGGILGLLHAMLYIVYLILV